MLAYLAGAIWDAAHPEYEFPPGAAYIVGLAVAFFLGGPVVRRIKGLRFDVEEQPPPPPAPALEEESTPR